MNCHTCNEDINEEKERYGEINLIEPLNKRKIREVDISGNKIDKQLISRLKNSAKQQQDEACNTSEISRHNKKKAPLDIYCPTLYNPAYSV